MSLEEVRTNIDRIDRQLLQLLNERAELVHAVGEIKRKEDLWPSFKALLLHERNPEEMMP